MFVIAGNCVCYCRELCLLLQGIVFVIAGIVFVIAGIVFVIAGIVFIVFSLLYANVCYCIVNFISYNARVYDSLS